MMLQPVVFVDLADTQNLEEVFVHSPWEEDTEE